MSYRAAAATNPRVKSVNFVEYLPGPDNTIVLVVNHSIYIGKYPTLDAAKQAVEGLLVKCGADNPEEIRTKILRTDNKASDLTPVSLNWSNITSTVSTGVYNRTVLQVTGITDDIRLIATRSNLNADLWYKQSSVTISGTADPATDGYTLYKPDEIIVVKPDTFLSFKGKPPRSLGISLSTTWTITNISVSPNVTLDTLSLTVNP